MTRDLNLVVVLSALAQVAAFLKSILVAYYFGISPELDGYFLAQVVPAIVTGTAAGVLQSSFVPTYVKLRAEGRIGEAAALAGRLLQVIAVAGLALVVLISLLAPQIVRFTAPLADPAVASAAIYSLRILSLLLLMNATADFLALLLNAEMRFAGPALAPIANAAVASAFLLLAPELGLANLVWGTLLGLAAQIAVLFHALKRAQVPVRLHGGNAEVVHVGRLSLAALPSVVIANVAGGLPTLLAATLGPGALSAFSYAWKLHLAATQAAGIAVGTVMLPHFSGMIARRNYAEVRAALGRVVPLVFALAGLGLAWIWAAGEPFLRSAFQRGKFSSEDVLYVHRLWLLLALGLAPSIASIALAKVIQASSSFAQLAWFGVAGGATLYAVGMWLSPEFAAAGIAGAVVVSAWAVFALCAAAVTRLLPVVASDKPRLRHWSLLSIAAATACATALLSAIQGASDLALLLGASALTASGAFWLVRSK